MRYYLLQVALTKVIAQVTNVCEACMIHARYPCKNLSKIHSSISLIHVSSIFSLINDIIEMCSGMFLHMPDRTIGLQVSHDIMFLMWNCASFTPVWLGWHEKEMSNMLLISEKGLKIISTGMLYWVLLFWGWFFFCNCLYQTTQGYIVCIISIFCTAVGISLSVM